MLLRMHFKIKLVFGGGDLVNRDSLRACGFCGTVYTIDASQYSSRCPNCKSKLQNNIDGI